MVPMAGMKNVTGKDSKRPESDASGESPIIGILCWEEGSIPRGLQQLEELPGNSTNPLTFDFPLRYCRVEGANIHTVLEDPSPAALKAMIRAARRMEGEGIRAITTSCGFNAIFQKELSDAVRIPVFTSSLLQVPLVKNMLGKGETVGVITANKSALTERHLEGVGIDASVPVHIEGLESSSEWNKIFSAPEEDIEIAQVKEDLLRIARSMKEKSPIGAFVLECTDLPPFAGLIRKATDRPVFDFVTLTDFVFRALTIQGDY
jgi:hypothetical protein